MDPQEAYQWLVQHSREIAYLKSIKRLLSWDQRTQIPPKGHGHRARQLALLAGWIHERATDPQLAEKMALLTGSAMVQNPESVAAVNLREWRRSYELATKIPPELAVALAQAAAEGQTAWEQTRPRNDWKTFLPFLQRLVALKKEEAQALGYVQEPYDALLDSYEPGATAAELAPLFTRLRDALSKLLAAMRGSHRRPESSCLRQTFPLPAQEHLARTVAERLGYDFAAGRLDPTAHPFSINLGPGDARITTRYEQGFFNPAFFGTLHEVGHALYNQGLPEEHWGTPMGEVVSLGIHESQSRLWENFVGRSFPFWTHFYPLAQKVFPGLQGVALQTFHLAVNEVRPGLIRTEADEVTYNLHILVRFELERAIFQGDLEVTDLPGAWHEKVKEILGLATPDFRQGVMQDIHWAAGHFGYFPTYSLGNLYAAQIMATAEAEVGDLAAGFSQGTFLPLLEWLRRKIHRQGKRYRPRPLIRAVTGENPDPQYLLAYLQKKYGALYNFS